MANQAELHTDLRSALVALPTAVGDERLTDRTHLRLGTRFDLNVKNMKQGLGYTSEPAIAFNPGGPVNHGPGFYNFEKSDFSPRISIAYSPRPHGGLPRNLFGENDKTVIRAGFSRVYDRAGFALLNTSDQVGAAGLTTTLQNTCCTLGVTGAEDLPRVTGINTIPRSTRMESDS